MKLVNALLILYLLPIASILANNYCATISAGGAQGFVALVTKNNVAYYNLSLSLENFATSCPLQYGLTYHIHSYWSNTSASSTVCGSAATGGHFDPNFACSNASQSYSTSCKNLGRTKPLGYTYNCSTTNYHFGRYSFCEVGDLSGKMGKLNYNSATQKLFSTSFTDFQPPYDANFKLSDQTSLPWSSVVFHCGSTGARLLCAEFSTSTASSSCSTFFSSINGATDDDDGGFHFSSDDTIYTASELNAAVVLSVFISLIFGVIIGIVFISCGYPKWKEWHEKKPSLPPSTTEANKASPMHENNEL
eukprot:gene11899-15922_t